jgi:hypothetical protein
MLEQRPKGMVAAEGHGIPVRLTVLSLAFLFETGECLENHVADLRNPDISQMQSQYPTVYRLP